MTIMDVAAIFIVAVALWMFVRFEDFMETFRLKAIYVVLMSIALVILVAVANRWLS